MIGLLRKAIANSPAMNTLMISIIVVGLLSLYLLRREVFPEFKLEIVIVTVPYPGASPEEVEEGICQKMEEAVRSTDGIKKQTAVAAEGMATLVLELKTNVDPQRVLNEVRSEIDRIPSFPLEAEDPIVKQLTLREPAINIGVIGPDDTSPLGEMNLREIVEQVREDVIRLPFVSQANIKGAKEYEIDVELSEETLRQHGLTLSQVAEIIRSENLELPAGTIRADAQDVLVKSDNKRSTGREIEQIPIISQASGLRLTLGDLGEVRDEFADITAFTRINGKPGMAIAVERTSTEDLLLMTDRVRQYVAEKKLPSGYSFVTWGDRSIEVRDRLRLLVVNGIQGLILVVVLLTIFLDLRLAWWVAVGIPISLLGTCAVLYFSGQTLNMLTSFTFVMALGIVVDDAIVIGENVYTHRKMGKSPMQAAIDGASEVVASVFSSVATTVVAFVPLLFVSGVMGKFIAVMPLTMISTLLFSLFEASFALPCHLAHESSGLKGMLPAAIRTRNRMPAVFRWTFGTLLVACAWLLSHLLYPFRGLSKFVERINKRADAGLEYVSATIYMPVLRWSLSNHATVICIAVTSLLLSVSLYTSGIVQYDIFPKIDSNTIHANITYPDGTPVSVTDAATKRLEDAVRRLNDRYSKEGSPVLLLTRRSVGHITDMRNGPMLASEAIAGHLGSLTAELIDTSERTIRSDVIINEWRKLAGQFPGAEQVVFGSTANGPGGTPIEFKLLCRADQVASLESAVEETKARLSAYPGVLDVGDDSSPGKWEFQLKIKPEAVAMGVPLADLAKTVRASYYGEEVMRLQRGRHEVKLMVRYPREDRRSLAEFDQIRIRTGNGAERPLTELADVEVARGYSKINRVDQLRSITISTDIDEALANASEVVADLQKDFMPQLLAKHPGLLVRWEGQQEQTNESVESLMVGLLVALVVMYVMLTLEFTSYVQPLIIMLIIPFGFMGAIIGHAMLGLPITLFSLFGFVALTGIVVNDSIVLIDFINMEVRNGSSLHDALMNAGQRRLRPIFLTSVTTIAGLLPLLAETSIQAQILIPMAVSISFGLFASTLLCLIQVPVFYAIYAQMVGLMDETGHDAAPTDSENEIAEAV
jgi:hydrophobic/amphiphilic exporter-1 (mainly G- bacteria), HAE1 family